ncbi:gephyrin-like molybdotransferase Glp [Roseateles saccharophilus]|uniref:Molybdopterin molybdenumtransferase n=1 Tax=Roseateles saccharophilus TaxID=304 RepID=A0A4V2VPV5_ROSSA|nr:gephyrin-like molybdotransferase Glp [Roseateles saccharophilus]MDG0833553.1 molybdopterin molybdenumtransferase MoeA [Roseateles saccharophilus]TCU92199.1 molybdopterin molybdotransferase [Roseateles saccharophilus]
MSEAAKKPALTPLDDALATLLAQIRPLAERETLPTSAARGRVLAADLISPVDVPPADNSAMDGYALRAADAAAVLPVTQRIPAGSLPQPLAAGEAARIFTGAQVPAGADSVVMQEHTELVEGRLRVTEPVRPGQHVRLRGEDVRAGSVVLPAGTRLDAVALGLAATAGAAELAVTRRPRVALFSTGDELVMPGEPLPPGAIYNSNRFTLRALVEGLGCEVVDLGIVPDRLDATRAALREAAAKADVILTSGGVSVGEEDHLRPAVQAEGQLDLWAIAIKPGKPFAHGRVGEAHFIGLPGNPVSSLVTFLLLVRPVLLKLQGATRLAPRACRIAAGFDWPKPDKRREFLRVRLDEDGGLALFGNQSSGVLTSAFWADGLLDNPAGQAFAQGDTVRFLPFSELLS